MASPASPKVSQSALEWAKRLLADVDERKKLCHQEFSAADVDGNGSLDLEEVKALIAKLCKVIGIKCPKDKKVAELVKKVDKSGDGDLQYNEFAMCFKAVLQSCVSEAERERLEFEAAEAEADKRSVPVLAEPTPLNAEAVAMVEKIQEEVDEGLHTKDLSLKEKLEANVITDLMVAEKNFGIDKGIEERARTRAYFMWLDGVPGDHEQHYFEAIGIELKAALEQANDPCIAAN